MQYDVFTHFRIEISTVLNSTYEQSSELFVNGLGNVLGGGKKRLEGGMCKTMVVRIN